MRHGVTQMQLSCHHGRRRFVNPSNRLGDLVMPTLAALPHTAVSAVFVPSYLDLNSTIPSTHFPPDLLLPYPFQAVFPIAPLAFAIMGGAPVTPPLPPPSSSAPHLPSYPAPQEISSHLTLQAPLSRRGHGPGLVLVLDHYALIEKSEKHLDPPPLQKWAEEGFCVAQVTLTRTPRV